MMGQRYLSLLLVGCLGTYSILPGAYARAGTAEDSELDMDFSTDPEAMAAVAPSVPPAEKRAIPGATATAPGPAATPASAPDESEARADRAAGSPLWQLGPIEVRALLASASLGYGMQLGGADQSPNPFRTQIGGRLGALLNDDIYTGLAVLLNAGSQTTVEPSANITMQREVFMLQYGLEVGLQRHLGPWYLRPYGGLGVSHRVTDQHGDLVVDSIRSTSQDVYLVSGCLALLEPFDRIQIGADARLTALLADGPPVALAVALAAEYRY